MQKKAATIPKFRNEREEAEWWSSPEGQATTKVLVQRARAAGKIRRRKTDLKTISMRLPLTDIEAAKQVAQRKGIPYQTYIKMVLREALSKERRSA
jgi:predicted DNA binding CopG/RHH family protein